MAVFFKTPAPPGAVRAVTCDCVIVRTAERFEQRQLVRRPSPLAWTWSKGPDGRLGGRWTSAAPASKTQAEPLRLAIAG